MANYGNDWKVNGGATKGNPTDYRAQPPQTFCGRLRRHYARFWWLHLILTVIITLIVVLITLYVAAPAISQSQLNKSTLSLYQQIVTNATPTSVHLHLVTLSQSNSSFHPTIGAFNTSLFLENTEPNIIPFGYLQVPSVQALHEKYIVVDQEMTIADMDQFIAYNKLIVSSESYRVAMRGKTTIHEGALPVAHVDFNKVITSPGMNGLQGFKVLNFNVSLLPAADGTNVKGQVLIPNPTNISVSMGEVTQNLYVNGQYIGNNTIANLLLNPGNNVFNFTGVSDQATVIGLISQNYTNGILPVTIIGNTSIVNGQHIPYFESALQSAPLFTELDVGAALAAIGVNVTSNGQTSNSQASSSQTSSSQTSNGHSSSTTSSAPTTSTKA